MILCLDFETTGLTLHPKADLRLQPRAIEFGAMLLSPRTGKCEEECSILINPGVPLEPIITKITGLTDDDLKDAPTFVQALPQIRRIFECATALVAHNLPFDRAILRGELARAEIVDFPWPKREFCTVQLYREEYGRNPKLLELYQDKLGKPLAQTHRALDDVAALVEILRHEGLLDLMVL